MRLIPILAVVLFAVSCTSPHDVVLPRDFEQLDKDEKLKTALTKLSDEEKALFAGYMLRAGLGQAFGGEGILPGTTLGDALERQRAWMAAKAKEEAEAAALAERVRKEREVKAREMNQALTVAVTELRLRPENFDRGIYSDYFAITVAIDNKTEKNLAGAKGTIVVSDMFGETIKRIGLAYDDGVKAGRTAVWRGSMDHNQFMAKDKKLAATKFENMRFTWEPETYLFEDGSVMSAVGSE